MTPKFRAWHKKEKSMYVVLNIYFDTGRTPIVTVSSSQSSDGLMELEVGVDCELMQSTGLNDKNSKENFDGDVCSFKDDHNEKHIGIIKQENGCWIVKSIVDDEEGNHTSFLWETHDDRITIGNIYENPELLEVKE